MGTTISPSDFTEINPDYTQGRGFIQMLMK